MTPSEVVSSQLRALRGKRGWKQEELAARLEQLGMPGWRQSKIAKIENGQVKRLPLEDVFELALALDVAPVYLLVPPSEQMRFGPKLTRWPQQVRRWLDGSRPLLGRVDYKTDEEAGAGWQFFFFGSRPLGDLRKVLEDPWVAQHVRVAAESEEEE